MQKRSLAKLAGMLLVCACAQGGTQSESSTSTDSADSRTDGHHADAGPAAFGDPLPRLAAADLALFNEGKTQFAVAEDIEEGIGPVFNEASCAACHLGPELGGSNGRLETRFGRRGADGRFDPLASEGGSLLQDHGIGDFSGFVFGPEVVPADANVVAQRRTTPLFGLGLVDATPDERFQTLAKKQAREAPEVAGVAPLVPDRVNGGTRVGKFGWKSQNPNLLQFSADAYLNEMGITSPLFPDENCPQGRCGDLANNPDPGLNDADGADVFRFANFMLFLGAPPRGPVSEKTRTGERSFVSIGCAACHTPSLRTGPNAVKALDRVEYAPYSDFLLHDMGSLGDGIEQGPASGTQMRTAPLWGLRVATSLLHDGRASTIEEAILAHDGQAARARTRFQRLGDRERQALLAFLESL
jgi:CxxC motif-containing protein (DUF1111 family)